jgi:hypothetical protein
LNSLIQQNLHLNQAQCGDSISQVLTLLQRYQEDGWHGSAKQADKDLQSLHALLFENAGPTNPCFNDAATAYLFGSLAITTANPGNAQQADVQADPLFLLAVTLQNSGRIELLTPSVRKKLGAGWSTNATSPAPLTSPYQLRGAFSCVASKIYIDPEIPPINLAANLEHEIDHLVRDRTSYIPANADWKTILLKDEVLALATGVYRQLRLSSPTLLHSRWVRALSDGYDQTYHPYRTKDDDNLFAKDGPFSSMYYGGGSNGNSAQFIANFLLETYEGDLVVTPYVEKIYKAVADVYFPGETMSPDAIRAELPSAGAYLGGLFDWLPNSPFVQPPLANTFAAIQTITQHLDIPSDSCRALIAHQNDPEVQKYVGTHLSIDGDSPVPGMPGEGGVKGGEGGVKGGEGGVKGGEPVRACLILEQNQ